MKLSSSASANARNPLVSVKALRGWFRLRFRLGVRLKFDDCQDQRSLGVIGLWLGLDMYYVRVRVRVRVRREAFIT